MSKLIKKSPKQRSKSTLHPRGITIVSPSHQGNHQFVIMRYIEENSTNKAKLIINEQEGHPSAQMHNTISTWDQGNTKNTLRNEI
jgi:hypothetical protein